MYIHSYIATCNVCSTTVISRPDDVTVCEGGSASFTCVLNRNIEDNVQWYRLINDTSTTERVEHHESDTNVVSVSNQNNFTTTLTIANAIRSYTGYYWVRLPSDDVCYVSLTVTGM